MSSSVLLWHRLECAEAFTGGANAGYCPSDDGNDDDGWKCKFLHLACKLSYNLHQVPSQKTAYS
eukprot:6869226-Karenia_brevis.AAC.1